MLELKVYSVFDSKAGVYGQPFYSVNNESAMRDFIAAAMDKDTKIGYFPGDFTLFHLGVFNTMTGKISCSDVMENLGTALQLLSQWKQSQGDTVFDGLGNIDMKRVLQLDRKVE